jgi:hypothetical protein
MAARGGFGGVFREVRAMFSIRRARYNRLGGVGDSFRNLGNCPPNPLSSAIVALADWPTIRAAQSVGPEAKRICLLDWPGL